MKKSFNLKTILALFLAVGLFGLVVTGCDSPINDKPVDDAPASFTVTFDSDGGTAIESQTVKEGECATKPANPEKTGYTFGDWFAPNAEAAFDFATPITADITLKAKWTINKYTVTFDSDGGSAVDPVTVEYGKTVTRPADPTKDGLFFAGWYTDKELTKKFEFTTEITSNITLYAKWSADPVYAITLKLNYEGAEDLKEEADSDGSYKITEPAPPRKGYKLLGWFTDEQCTVKYDFANAFTADSVLYAKWEIITYTIAYELDGGTNYANAPTSYTVETETITLGTPAKADYNFVAWYKEAEKTNKIETIEKGSTGNLTLYALWEDASKSFNVSFTIGGTEVKNVTVEKGTTVSRPEINSEILTKIGKTDLNGYVTWNFDFTKEITKATTVEGTWNEVNGYVNTNPFNTVEAAAYSGFYVIPVDPAKPAADWRSVDLGAKCLDIDGNVVTAAYSQAQVIVVKSAENWGDAANQIASQYNLGAPGGLCTVTIPSDAASAAAIVIQRSDKDLDKIAYIEVTSITWNERTAITYPELTKTGYVNFADIPGYSTDFDPDKYDQIYVTVQLLDGNGESLVTFTDGNFGYSKLCLNDTENKTALEGQYGPGYGDGYIAISMNQDYWKGFYDTANPDYVTFNFIASEQYGTKGYKDNAPNDYKSMNCVSAQLDKNLAKIRFISIQGISN